MDNMTVKTLPARTTERPKGSPFLSPEKYKCGWCGFTACRMSGINKHHMETHPTLKIDVVKLDKPKHTLLKTKILSPKIDTGGKQADPGMFTNIRSPPSLSASGMLASERVVTALFVRATANNQLTSSTTSDNGTNTSTVALTSSGNPLVKNLTAIDIKCPHDDAPPQILPHTISDTSGQYSLPPVHVCCVDILKCGVIHLLKTATQAGVSRLCLDCLQVSNFIDTAKRHKNEMAFHDTTTCPGTAEGLIDMDELTDMEIETMCKR